MYLKTVQISCAFYCFETVFLGDAVGFGRRISLGVSQLTAENS